MRPSGRELVNVPGLSGQLLAPRGGTAIARAKFRQAGCKSVLDRRLPTCARHHVRHAEEAVEEP